MFVREQNHTSNRQMSIPQVGQLNYLKVLEGKH